MVTAEPVIFTGELNERQAIVEIRSYGLRANGLFHFGIRLVHTPDAMVGSCLERSPRLYFPYDSPYAGLNLQPGEAIVITWPNSGRGEDYPTIDAFLPRFG